MTAVPSIDLALTKSLDPGEFLHEQLAQASPDLMRELLALRAPPRRNRVAAGPSRCHRLVLGRRRRLVCRVAIIRATMNRECAQVITSTGSNTFEPSSSGIFLGGNHTSHCAASPGSHVSRSAGSTGRCSGRSCRTLSRNHVIDPVQPTRSAITVAGMSGVVVSSCRTSGSNAVNDVATAGRSYFGGRPEATARATVDRPTPRSRATHRAGTPSATSRRIRAQSSTDHPLLR